MSQAENARTSLSDADTALRQGDGELALALARAAVASLEVVVIEQRRVAKVAAPARNHFNAGYKPGGRG